MAADEVPLDDKAKRMRDLLSSFYSTDQSSVTANPTTVFSKFATLDTINSPSFDPQHYMNLLVQKSNLETVLQRHVEMAAEIKNLDTDLQMLVYENYNKFISATETIKRMNSNIVGMEANMEQLLEKILSVQSRSDGVNSSLFERREHIEKLHRTRNLLRKIQFIYDLPERLGKCIKSEAYADAVKFYTGAMPIFKAYGESSFQDCKKASEEAVSIIIKNLQGKIFSDSDSIQARAEAVMLLKQLNFPVDNLKDQLFEKLEQSLGDVQLHFDVKIASPANSDEPAKQDAPDHIAAAHDVSTHELVEAVRAYRVIFPDSELELIRISHDLVIKYFENIEKNIKNHLSSAELLGILRFVWDDVLLMDEVLPEASVAEICLEAANHAIKLYISGSFAHLLRDISDSLMKVQVNQKEPVKDHPLKVKLEASKKAVIQGSMGVFLDLRLLMDDNLPLLIRMRDSIVDWVQEGFQDFFISLYNRFLLLAGKNNSTSQDLVPHDGMQSDKTLAGLVLVLAQLSVFIDQNVVPRITEEIATSFFSGSIRRYERGPAFVPVEICRIYRSAAETFLHLYIKLRTQRVSVLLKKRFTTPNWIRHKEPREVHMFVDLFLQEMEGVLSEVKQLLPESPTRKHRRADSVSNSSSSTSSRSNTLRDDRLLTRSNLQQAKSQLLESHLAKIFKQKMEIFTKVDATQDSILTIIAKLCLKSLQEFVRLQTFNRSGFQQIQLDSQCLRISIKDNVEDEAAVDFLLDEVIIATAERCLDPIPLEPAVLDRLVQIKLDKRKEETPSSQ